MGACKNTFIKIRREIRGYLNIEKIEYNSCLAIVAHSFYKAAPRVPQSLSVTDFDDQTVSLDWADLTTPFDDYKIYVRNVASGIIEQEISGISLSEVDVLGLTNNDEYEFWTVSVRDGIESGDSNHVTAIPQDLTSPSPPTGLSVDGELANQINLSWNANPESDLAGYNIYYRTGANPFQKHNSSFVPSISYNAGGLSSENITYDFKITAVDNAGNESSFSPTVQGTTPDVATPSPPINIQLLEEGSMLRIGGDPSPTTDVVGYNAYYDDGSTISKDNGSLLSEIDISDYEFQNPSGGTYDFWFTAVDEASNESSPSTKVTGEISAVPAGYIGIFSDQDLRDINNDLTADYYLMNDIDLSSWDAWVPIGVDDTGNLLGSFTGEFNGGGHVIRNAEVRESIDGFGTEYGLFARIAPAGLVKYLGVENFEVAGLDSKYDGAIAGLMHGTCEDCYAEGGTFYANIDRIGGFFGYTNGGTFTRCYSSMTENGNDQRTGGFGGYWGSNTTTACYFNNDIANSGTNLNSAVGKTASELQQEATFTGWDFDNIWQIDEGNDFPRLRKGIV